MAKKLAKRTTTAKSRTSATRKSSKTASSGGNGRSAAAQPRRPTPVRPDDFLSHRYVGEKSVKP